MYRKILVAYNGTPESRLALDEAIRFAPDASVEVHLAGVVHYPSAYLLAGEYVPEVALADERETHGSRPPGRARAARRQRPRR